MGWKTKNRKKFKVFGTLWAGVALLTALTPIAWAQTKDPKQGKTADTMGPKVLSDKLESSLKPTVDYLRAKKLSPQLIFIKAREGVAKSVADNRIVKVCKNLATYMVEAKQTFTHQKIPAPQWKKIPPSLIRAYAEARLAGIPTKHIHALLRTSNLPKQWSQVVSSLYFMMDVKIGGYPSKQTSRVLAVLLKKNSRVDSKKLKGALHMLHKRLGLSKQRATRFLTQSLRRHGSLPKALRSMPNHHLSTKGMGNKKSPRQSK